MKPPDLHERYRWVTVIEAASLLGFAEMLFELAAEFKDALCDADHGGPIDVESAHSVINEIGFQGATARRLLTELRENVWITASEYRRYVNGNEKYPAPIPTTRKSAAPQRSPSPRLSS